MGKGKKKTSKAAAAPKEAEPQVSTPQIVLSYRASNGAAAYITSGEMPASCSVLTLRLWHGVAQQAAEEPEQAVEETEAPAEVEVAAEQTAAAELAETTAAEPDQGKEKDKKVWEASRTEWKDPSDATPADAKVVSKDDLQEATRYA
jgi:hypothetical protein